MKFLRLFTINRGIGTAISCSALFIVFLLYPPLCEWVYRKGIFQLVRILWDHSLGLLPFSTFWIILPLWLILIWHFNRPKIHRGRPGWIRLLNGIGWIVTFFFVLWGFNYGAPLLQKQIPGVHELSDEELYSFGTEVHAELVQLLRQQEWGDSLGVIPEERGIRQEVEHVVGSFGIPAAGRVRVRVLDDHGLMRRLGIAGVYLPFFGEGYTNNTYLPITIAFIMAHEMSHGYGVSHEGEADLIAYLALSGSENNQLKYAAGIELFRSIRGRLKAVSPELYGILRSETNPSINATLFAIFRNGLGYQEYVPGVQNAINDAYLKTMGISSGTASYDSFVDLVWRYRELNPVRE